MIFKNVYTMNIKNMVASGEWTLFLDRDGVINVRLPDAYVRSWDEFTFIEKVPEAVAVFARYFRHIIIVTNQQGIGKGLMTEDDLGVIHGRMISCMENAGGKIDAVYHCPHLKNEGCTCRKPLPGMARQAAAAFPDIDLSRSVMAGDSSSDMAFAVNAGMVPVLIGDRVLSGGWDGLHFDSLWTFSQEIDRCVKK